MTNRVLFRDLFCLNLTELEKRAAHRRLFTEIQFSKAISALLLRAMPTPARPTADAVSSPDRCKKNFLVEFGQESCTTVENF